MNREIKFRAWCDNLEVMFDYEYVMIDKDGTWIKIEPTKSSLDNNLILMQYTGLKDKNGLEIYEGDIVATKNSKYKVVFDKCCFWGIDEMGRYPIYQISHYIMDDERFAVIGNIYENPELLEAQP